MDKNNQIRKEILEQHSKLGGKNIFNVEPTPAPVAYFPSPTKKQYKKGYFIRYFVVHYRGTVIEVSQKFMKDNQTKLPKIYMTYSVKWYISDTSQDPTVIGMDSPRASYRNRFLVQSIPNPALTNYLGKDWEQFKL